VRQLKEDLLNLLDEARVSALAQSEDYFHFGMTLVQLENMRQKFNLDKKNGSKEDIVSSYQLQYVTHVILEKRQMFMKTKKRFDEFKKWLPWYRVLFAGFRRLHYLQLAVYKDEE
jgi:hypothetical protein